MRVSCMRRFNLEGLKRSVLMTNFPKMIKMKKKKRVTIRMYRIPNRRRRNPCDHSIMTMTSEIQRTYRAEASSTNTTIEPSMNMNNQDRKQRTPIIVRISTGMFCIREISQRRHGSSKESDEKWQHDLYLQDEQAFKPRHSSFRQNPSHSGFVTFLERTRTAVAPFNVYLDRLVLKDHLRLVLSKSQVRIIIHHVTFKIQRDE